MIRRLGASNRVLLILCLMYLILYVDRVNISTAAPLIKAETAEISKRLGGGKAGSLARTEKPVTAG